MTDDRPRPTRRGFLALGAGALTAGCGGLPNPLSSSPPSVDARRLTEITADGVPAISRPVPVDVGDAHREAHADRARGLLDRAPLPFDRDEIPNGAMREEVTEAAEAARAALDRADAADSPFETLEALRDARAEARVVATAWAYVDEGVRRDDLAAESDALTADVADFDERRSYVGDDPVRALLVHAAVESLTRTATVDVDGRSTDRRFAWRAENLVTVSEAAAELERARAALDDAAAHFDRLRADLATQRDLRGAFVGATEELAATLEAETAGFDGSDPVESVVDADVADSPVRHPLEQLHRDLAGGAAIDEHRDDGKLATALVSAHRELTRLYAFEDLRARVADGESFAVEDAEDVAAYRRAAVSAIETALRESAHPGLSRRVLHALTGLVERADVELAYDGRETVPVSWIRRDVGVYLYAAAVARATPGASATVAEALGR